jgi:hypothetical protein
MPRILLQTTILASAETCFDLSRCVDIHLLSTSKTGEKAVGGKVQGLLELHDTITWRARHLGVVQELTSRITAYDRPRTFSDEMERGAFKSLLHQHVFEEEGGYTQMTDLFDFEAPCGVLGRFACALFLTQYLRRFLMERNALIKEIAESDQAARFIHPSP